MKKGNTVAKMSLTRLKAKNGGEEEEIIENEKDEDEVVIKNEEDEEGVVIESEEEDSATIQTNKEKL